MDSLNLGKNISNKLTLAGMPVVVVNELMPLNMVALVAPGKIQITRTGIEDSHFTAEVKWITQPQFVAAIRVSE